MPITTIVAPPPRDGSVTQEAYSDGFDLTLQTMKQAIDDINANASQYNVATSTTSSSSVLIGTGAKTFTVPAGLGFVLGMTLRIANSSTNFMTGEVTSYSSTTLVMNITTTGGSGTFASWSISMAAVGANTAASVSNTPAGNIAATTVQAAINELDTEKLSSAAGAVTDTNLSTIATGATTGDSASIPVITFTSKGRVTSVTTAPKIASGTLINTTSGTSHTFTGISAQAKKITLMFSGVSGSGTSNYLLRIGDAGGIENTGYNSSANQAAAPATDTTGFIISANNVAADAFYGTVVLYKFDGNTWISNGNINQIGTTRGHVSAGNKTLSDTLTQLVLTFVNGTDTFDAGAINILIE